MSIGPQRPESMLGQVIADYELTAFIGTGATGLVYRGRRTANAPASVEQTGRVALEFPEDAAIKLLVPPLGATQDELEDFQRRFVREARILKQLDHPHILPVIDYGQDTDSGYFYMILTYMAGGSLANMIATRGPLSLAETSSILAQVADALDYAHTEQVVHRDVKPGNILLDAHGTPFLSDFSIVRVVSEAATQRTTTGRMMGTPAYMAPEQFDDSSNVGAAADIYGLGMVVYEMVTGHAAFGSTSWAQVMRQQLMEAPTLPGATRPDLPRPAEAAIMQALAKEPAQRFPTAASFARAFSLGLQGQWADGLTRYVAPSARPTTSQSAAQTMPARMPDRPQRRSRVGVLGAAVLLLLVCACVAGIAFAGQSGPLAILTAFMSHTPTTGAQATTTLTQTIAPTGSHTPGAHATATPKKGGGANGSGAAPTATTVRPPTATSTPTLPNLVISANASQSTDGQAHDSNNPYYFTGSQAYGNVTIQAGAWAMAISACNGGGSGTVQFSATGTVSIAGTLSVTAEGYCGGRQPTGASGGYQGESYQGSSQQQTGNNYGGGGGGAGADSGGAGGGYGTAGQPAVNGPDIPATYGGQVYGNSTVATLFLGSGGGSSGAQSTCLGGAGGNGGGAISIRADTITVTGSMTANGGNGQSERQGTSTIDYRGGGGGSGGSIVLYARVITISGVVTAVGGQGGAGARSNTTYPASGGVGGDGRIHIVYTQNMSGATTPAAH